MVAHQLATRDGIKFGCQTEGNEQEQDEEFGVAY